MQSESSSQARASIAPAPCERIVQLPYDARPVDSLDIESGTIAFEIASRDEVAVIAAFAILLHRYSGQASISLDVTQSGRQVALDLEMAGSTPATLVDQVVAELRVATVTDPMNRVRVAVALDGEPSLEDLDLHLAIRGGTHITVTYDARSFQRATVERLISHLQALVVATIGRLETPVGELSLLSEVEHAWLQDMGSGSRRRRPAALTHEAIEHHAALLPDAVAVRYLDRELTYDRLNRRANQLAHYLVDRHIGVDCCVAVCLHPSLDIEVALLGILKAGAVYVPIDPTYPAGRVRALLAETEPALVIADAAFAGGHAPTSSIPTIMLDDPEIVRAGDDNLHLTIEGSRTTHVYFTSGTTGAPKGVLASHENLSAYLDNACHRYEIGGNDVMPAIARFGFSISMFELLAPLVAGGTALILDREHVLDLGRLARTLEEVTVFHAGPSLLKRLLPFIEHHYPDLASFARVRHASSGGDMIPPGILEALKRVFAAAEVFVIYGCSEISCMGCTYAVPRERAVERTFIGRPFENTVVRVVDGGGRPVPIGVLGEIWVAGDGVVKGYLGRPDLTAAKFVAHDGLRFYRTGDLGRVTSAGQLEIAGRNDFQIKVRGMRIELGEVEAHLRHAPEVQDAVVIGRPNQHGDTALVAYVVLAEDSSVDSSIRLSAVRSHMVATVPDYLVPERYVALRALPLNHNMKLDRGALPDPDSIVHDENVRLPRTMTECRMAALWRRIAGVAVVHVDDHFFDLGVDSILAMEMMVCVETELHAVIDGMDVLREPLEVLAAICDRQTGTTDLGPVRSRVPARHAIETFYFGDGLHGALYSADGDGDAAVLICAPIGQEGVRAGVVFGNVARELTERGIPTLQFDYYGLGDSGGDSADATPSRWCRDIASAHAELVRRTSAKRITVIGARLGATLLCNSAIEVDRLVLWDPVSRGMTWYEEQCTLHLRHLRGLRHLARTRWSTTDSFEECLGLSYSRVARRQLQMLALEGTVVAPTSWLATSGSAGMLRTFEGVAKPRDRFADLAVDCGWNDATRLEDFVTGAVARALVAIAVES